MSDFKLRIQDNPSVTVEMHTFQIQANIFYISKQSNKLNLQIIRFEHNRLSNLISIQTMPRRHAPSGKHAAVPLYDQRNLNNLNLPRLRVHR